MLAAASLWFVANLFVFHRGLVASQIQHARPELWAVLFVGFNFRAQTIFSRTIMKPNVQKITNIHTVQFPPYLSQPQHVITSMETQTTQMNIQNSFHAFNHCV